MVEVSVVVFVRGCVVELQERSWFGVCVSTVVTWPHLPSDMWTEHGAVWRRTHYRVGAFTQAQCGPAHHGTINTLIMHSFKEAGSHHSTRVLNSHLMIISDSRVFVWSIMHHYADPVDYPLRMLDYLHIFSLFSSQCLFKLRLWIKWTFESGHSLDHTITCPCSGGLWWGNYAAGWVPPWLWTVLWLSEWAQTHWLELGAVHSIEANWTTWPVGQPPVPPETPLPARPRPVCGRIEVRLQGSTGLGYCLGVGFLRAGRLPAQRTLCIQWPCRRQPLLSSLQWPVIFESGVDASVSPNQHTRQQWSEQTDRALWTGMDVTQKKHFSKTNNFLKK